MRIYVHVYMYSRLDYKMIGHRSTKVRCLQTSSLWCTLSQKGLNSFHSVFSHPTKRHTVVVMLAKRGANFTVVVASRDKDTDGTPAPEFRPFPPRQRVLVRLRSREVSPSVDSIYRNYNLTRWIYSRWVTLLSTIRHLLRSRIPLIPDSTHPTPTV